MWPKKNSAFALFAGENQSVKDKEHKTELGDPLSSLEFWESEWREWVPTGQVVRRDRPRDLEPRTRGERPALRMMEKSQRWVCTWRTQELPSCEWDKDVQKPTWGEDHRVRQTNEEGGRGGTRPEVEEERNVP